MAGFCYFFERCTRAQIAPDGRLSRSLLASRGLDQVLADVVRVPADAAVIELSGSGPSGGSGAIVAPHPIGGEPGIRVGYFPQFQAWEEVADWLWLGHDREHPPTPEDLRRRKQFAGHPVTLAGAEWLVPIVRDQLGGTRLGRDWHCAADGQVEERIKAEHQALWDEFAAVVDLFFDPADPSPAGVFRMDASGAMRHSLAALGLNYRFGPHEQNALHLVDAESWMQILAAAVDVHTFWDVFTAVQQSKKKRDTAPCPERACGSDGTAPGGPAPCPATAPAAES